MSSASDSHFTGEVITLSFGPAANDVTALYFNQQVTNQNSLRSSYCCLCAHTASHARVAFPCLTLRQWDEVRDTLPTSTSSAADTSTASTIDWRVLFRTTTSTTSSTPHFIPRLIALSLPSQTGYYPGIGDVIDYSALLSSTSRSSAASSSTAATSQWSGRTQLNADPDDIAALQQRQRRAGGGSAAGSSGSECWTDWLRLDRLHDKNVYRLKPLQNEDDAFEYFTLGHHTIQQQHGVSTINRDTPHTTAQ